MSQSRKMARRMVLMLAGVAILFGLVFGWGALKAYFIAKYLAGFANQVQTVATMTAEETPWQPALDSVGSISAINGAALSAEVAGIVDSINFQSGATVPAGALLVTLRPNNDPAVLAQLQATAQLDQITYDRDLKQFQADAVSQAQVDTDRANLAAAQAQVDAQKATMAEKVIRAPFAGTLGIRQVNLGQYLEPGTQIVTLQQLDPLYANFYLPQQALAQLQVGQTVHVGVDAFPGQDFLAKVTAIDSQVDSATRSVEVQATLPNPGLRLRPGLFASIKIETSAPHDFITLPQTAITYNPYGDTVFIVKHGQDEKGQPELLVNQVFVTLGDTRGDQVAVLSGVNPGDVVVTAGQLKLRNGSPVVINNDVQPDNNPNPNPPNE